MSILGNWFKKEGKQRLQTQKTAADIDVAHTDVEETDVKKTKSTASKTAKRKEKQAEDVVAMQMSPILIRPHITEKAAHEQASGVYTFVVAAHATKNEIAKAIARTYKVQPEKIRVMNMRGKGVRWGGFQGQRNYWKKALVYLKHGDTMIIHEGT